MEGGQEVLKVGGKGVKLMTLKKHFLGGNPVLNSVIFVLFYAFKSFGTCYVICT